MSPAEMIEGIRRFPGSASWLRPCDWREIAEYLMERDRCSDEIIRAQAAEIAQLKDDLSHAI